MSLPNDAAFIRLIEAIPTYRDTITNAARVRNLIADTISSRGLYVDGDITLRGTIVADITLRTRIFLPDGTVTAPSLTFTNNDDLGIYRSGIDELSFVANGVQTLIIDDALITSNVPIAVSTITTTTGNLSLNPNSGNIDCNGKDLLNVGNIILNTDYYTVLGSSVQTTDTTPTTILTIPTVSNRNYNIGVIINVFNTTDGTSSATIETSFKAKNLAGTVTISSALYTHSAIDTSLLAIAVSTAISSTNILIRGTGISATLKWYAVAKVFRQTIV